MFWAFGAVGLLLLVIAGLCAGLAASRLKRPSRNFPSLTSRLRVAVKASPFRTGPLKANSTRPEPIEAASNTATAILRAPASPVSAQQFRPAAAARPARNNRELQAGMMLAATLLGWAAGRRILRQPRRTPG
jgi:hypothetical protein